MKKPPYEKEALKEGIETAQENIVRLNRAITRSELEAEKAAFREGIKKEELRIAENERYIRMHEQWEERERGEHEEG
jgi:hypothetical protein